MMILVDILAALDLAAGQVDIDFLENNKDKLKVNEGVWKIKNDLLSFKFDPGSPSVEIALKHQVDFPDPIQYNIHEDLLEADKC